MHSESEVEPSAVLVMIHENLKSVTEISNFHESQKRNIWFYL